MTAVILRKVLGRTGRWGSREGPQAGQGGQGCAIQSSKFTTKGLDLLSKKWKLAIHVDVF